MTKPVRNLRIWTRSDPLATPSMGFTTRDRSWIPSIWETNQQGMSSCRSVLNNTRQDKEMLPLAEAFCCCPDSAGLVPFFRSKMLAGMLVGTCSNPGNRLTRYRCSFGRASKAEEKLNPAPQRRGSFIAVDCQYVEQNVSLAVSAFIALTTLNICSVLVFPSPIGLVDLAS